MRIKMADAPHTQSVLCLVTFMCFIILMSAVGLSADSLSHSGKLLGKRRLRRQASVSYHLQLTQPQAISEDAPDDTVLYDFKSVSSIDGKPTSGFILQVITNEDSNPQDVSVFTIDSQRQLVFTDSVPREERRQNYLDYEQKNNKLTVIIEASPINTGEDKKLIKLTIPLSDVNDELPVLKNKPVPYYASIPVDSREGDTVYILLAEDPDTNSALRYSIDVDRLNPGSIIQSIFRMEEVVDQTTSMLEGHIKIAIAPDFTLNDRYMIPIQVQDTRGDPRFPSQNITAEVDVLVGPRAPQFFQLSYEGSIFESKGSNNPVYNGSDSSKVLSITVHQFQENFPMVLRIMKDNNDVSTKFRIDEDGKVFSTESLEFDIQRNARPPTYQLAVKVVQTLDDSSTLEATVPLTITVKDENDNPPRFDKTQYLETIPEDTPPDTFVLTVLTEDNDSGKNAEVDYELTNDYFRIEQREVGGQTFGDIYVKKELDFDAEPGPIYRFSVTAKDRGSPVMISVVDVFITTSNVNDEPPVLEPQETLVLKDDVKVSATSEYILTRMRAKDIDGDDIQFYFSNSDQDTRFTRSEIFEINPTSGIITVIAAVPQNIDSYYLTVTAVDDGSCCGGGIQLTDHTSFVVEIVDTTNQKPVFENCLDLNPSVEEESQIGTPVVTVSANDEGRGVNGMVQYSIESPNPNLPDANFEIDKETGKITIKTPLDREPDVNFKQITVKAEDKAVPPQEGWCTFRVQIVDINDNDPVFARDYEQEVASTLSPPRSVLRVGATDKDIGDNGKISYHLTQDGNGVFSIYTDTGVIYVNKTFTPGVLEYNLVVKAEDHGSTPRSATAAVKIILKASENTQPPEFKPAKTSYEYSMAENIKPGSAEAVITTLQCESRIDTDLRVQFFIVSENGDLSPQGRGKFSINAFRVGDLFYVNVSVAENLDYETDKTHDIILRCQNFAALVMFKDIVLRVNVLDRNDNRPYFEGTVPTTGRYAGSIPENMDTEFTVVNNIQGYDDDITSEFNQLHFSIQDEPGLSEYFDIVSLGGNRAAITSSHGFDRETKDRHYLTIIADDIRPSDLTPGAQPNTATAVIEVIIEDINDNAMTFKEPLYTHSVKETANIGDVIFAVTADDEDEVDQGRLRYSFTFPTDLPFDIRDQTGDIFVTSKLDFESGKTEYLMTLESRDSSNHFKTTTQVKIIVTDENDNIPKFGELEYTVDDVEEEDTSISVNKPRKITTVSASDADTRNETKIRYQLLGKGTVPGDEQMFTIDEVSGEIQLVAVLDRDTTPEYIFTVEALDEEKDPQKGYVNVRVRPIDINDNKPVFDRESLEDSVEEGIPEGQFITQVEATDIDAGRNAEIEYEIVNSPATADGSQTNYFRVQTNGEIYSQVAPEYFDREQNPEFQVVIRAKDKGDRPLSSTATLTIKLLDINDNIPEFTEDVYTVLMSENTESGIIKEVVAIDQDIEKNAALRYILPPELNENNRHFTITSTNNKGYIEVSNPVDYEIKEQRHFMLQIKVQDSDDTHVDMASVNITVEDFNDNPPVFDVSYKSVNIKEGRLPGEVVTSFVATDKDSGINALKSYEIDRKSDPRREFYIDPDTGVVQTRKTLDREVSPTMSIIILAIDQGDPHLTGTATLHVVVDDVNDNYPIFKEDYRPVVDENQEDATYPLFVEEIFAIDLDTPIFGPNFGFALPDPCTAIACEKFMLTFEPDNDEGRGTAIITTNSVFDREEQEEYELPIIMWDMRGTNNPASQTGTNTLTIVIGDVNDNEPFPGHQDIFAQKFGDKFGSFVIGRVYVEDQDDWDLPDKTFTYLSPSSLASSFSINRDTGDVTMNKGVKANFGGPPYSFKVSVYDKVFDKTVVCTVAVTVKELTEEAIMKSGSVRLAGITASEFIQEPTNPRTGNKGDSLYTQFRVLMADKLSYPGVENIEITTLRDGDDYLEVRYAAHASPYLTPAEVDNAIIMNKADFESMGLTVMSIPVDECQDEIFEGGCFNKLNITSDPVTINANGTSYVGVNAFLVATEGCQADIFPETSDCSGDYCYNGGTCHKDAWGTLTCQNCPSGFTGARCQERRHHFDGSSIAFYKTLLQCEESQTSIEFVTDTKDGVLFYNGPMNALDPLQNPQDFILLKLEEGFPVLYIDHGTGILELKIDGKDKTGKQLLQSLNDGEWHHLDINRNGKEVELVVDRCKVAEAVNGIVEDNRACRVMGETPGVNMYLNVNTLLQLGGVRVFETVSHLNGISTPGFVGCMRNMIHNKELYNLNYRDVEGMNTGINGCPFEDEECGIPQNNPKCIHGRCEATMNGYSFCICDAGYFGANCNRRTTIRDFDKERQSYYYWQMKNEFYNTLTENKELTAHIRFRSRQMTGTLLYLYDQSSSPAQDIHLRLHNGKVQLAYNLGGGRKTLEMSEAQATNGQWHTLTMERYGTEFHLRLDNGEGRNYVYTLGGDPSERSIFRIVRHVYSGGYKDTNGRIMVNENLKSSCIEDVRVNNGYFAMNAAENVLADSAAEYVENPATSDGCRRTDCDSKTCPGKTCVELWEDHECRCNPGYYQVGSSQCWSLCIPNPCFNNVSCSLANNEVSCQCPPGWRGQLCDERNPEEVSSADLSTSALAAIIVSIIVILLLVIVVVLLYKFCGKTDDGEKFILEVDPEDDIRENVMNYDEEGAASSSLSDETKESLAEDREQVREEALAPPLVASYDTHGEIWQWAYSTSSQLRNPAPTLEQRGEEDQDAYDISRLQKPNFETSNRPYDPDKRRDVHRRDAPGDKPDVGVFIDDRLVDADEDDGAPPHDSVREFTFEGGDSDAGSLSSLNTSSSDRSQDYDYLNEWGPKFAKLADMYGAGQDLES